MVSVKWSAGARADLERLDRVIVKRILLKVSWIAENFAFVVPEQLTHDLRDFYKLRVGDYRLIYSVRNNTMLILSVGHRSEIYKI